MAVAEARAHGQHHVALQEQLVRVPLRGLDAHHARPQRMVLGDRALAHQRGGDRDVERLGERHQFLRGVRDDHATAGDDQRPLGVRQQLQRTVDGTRERRRPSPLERRVERQVELDVRPLLHVQRQIEQHRPRPALATDPERLAERPRQLRGLLDLVGPLADRLRDLDDVDRLEGLAMEHVGVRLAGDADHRDRVGQRRIEPGDHVRARGPGRTDADARLAGDARPAVGRVRPALLMAHRDVLDRGAAQRVVQRQDRRARNAEGDRHALVLQHADDGVHRLHATHAISSSSAPTRCEAHSSMTVKRAEWSSAPRPRARNVRSICWARLVAGSATP